MTAEWLQSYLTQILPSIITTPPNPKIKAMFLHDSQGRIPSRIDSPQRTSPRIITQHDTQTSVLFYCCCDIVAPWSVLIICWWFCSFFSHPPLAVGMLVYCFYAKHRWYYEQNKSGVFSKWLTERQFICSYLSNCAIILKNWLGWHNSRVNSIWMTNRCRL